MKYLVSSFPQVNFGIRCLILLSGSVMVPVLHAQNSIPLFSGPVDIRLSAAGTGFGASAVNFNSNTLNLTCPAAPITAVLSSTADSTGNLLVDNNINITVTAGTAVTGPTNVCKGGLNGGPEGPFQNCFQAGYAGPLTGPGNRTGDDPDSLVATYGVPPITISELLVPGPLQLTIALQDEGSGPGYYLASSSLYLNTNCSQNGVTGPAVVTGNPIPASGSTPTQLSQDFSFNPVTSQSIGFTYDLTAAQAAGNLAIQDGTIPQVADSPLDPAIFASQYVPGTSFSTSTCLIHSGESLPSGQPGCKLYTLECKVGTGANASGAQCPVSAQANEIVQDVFDGPPFTLSDIVTPYGTFHEGIGLIMANESWVGGPCTFDTAADLASLDCPQNLLTSFVSGGTQNQNVRKMLKIAVPAGSAKTDSLMTSRPRPLAESGSGTNTGSGRTTRPNSTFISVAQVPEDLTTVSVAGQKPGYWINSSTADVTFSSQPPNLTGSLLAGAATFVPSPIQSITYGISPASSVPAAGNPVANDVTLTNSTGCPTPPDLLTPVASVYAPEQQSFTGLADGYHLVHYFAQDCAGTQELLFTQDTSGNWSTNFYTYPINVDTAAPVVASGPTLSPPPSSQGTYELNQTVTATYSCTDALSGIVGCGSHTYAPGATNSTGTLTSVIDTSSAGPQVFTVQAVDAAGNTSSVPVRYQVSSQYDGQIQFSFSPSTVTYPQGANVVVQILPIPVPNVTKRAIAASSSTPTGTVKILDGTKTLQTLSLQGNGAAYGYIQGLSAGSHSLSVTYSGDAHDPSGKSAPVVFTVQPVPVTLSVSCWNPTFAFGADYNCSVHVTSTAGSAKGYVTYKFDTSASANAGLVNGAASFCIHRPPVGQHTVVVTYVAQTNFATATPQTEAFLVTPAPVDIALTPSTWYLTGGTLRLTAAVTSWSAGPPAGLGSITFSDGNQTLGVVKLDGYGHASFSIAASALSNGVHTFTAAYASGPNYGTGSTSIMLNVAHP